MGEARLSDMAEAFNCSLVRAGSRIQDMTPAEIDGLPEDRRLIVCTNAANCVLKTQILRTTEVTGDLDIDPATGIVRDVDPLLALQDANGVLQPQCVWTEARNFPPRQTP